MKVPDIEKLLRCINAELIYTLSTQGKSTNTCDDKTVTTYFCGENVVRIDIKESKK